MFSIKILYHIVLFHKLVFLDDTFLQKYSIFSKRSNYEEEYIKNTKFGALIQTKEDVELGVLFGTGVMEADKKLADATSFSIRGVLAGDRNFNSKVSFYEDQLLYTNKDSFAYNIITYYNNMINN